MLDIPLYESGGQVIREIVGQKPVRFDSIAAVCLEISTRFFIIPHKVV